MKVFHQVFTDKLFLISLGVALLTLFIGLPTPHDIDWQTIGSLFALMLVVQTFQFLGLFERLAETLTQRVADTRRLVQLFILLAFISSMFLTNDVAILTLVPLLAVSWGKMKLKPALPVVLICLAANLGSLLLPIGNPQNLFLYTHYHLTLGTFLKMGTPLWLISLVLLLLASLRIKQLPLHQQIFAQQPHARHHLIIAIVAAIVVLLGVFHLLPLSLAIIIALGGALLVSPTIFRHVDYALLLTFICFFIAVSDIRHASLLTQLLEQLNQHPLGVYLSSLGLSQVISNVPTAVLWGPFTHHVQAVFLGTNIGGVGTLLASLANLLAYKQYHIHFPHEQNGYLTTFSLWNFGLLIILGALGLLLLLI